VRSALITGVAGQDGAHLARHLLALGYRVIGTVPNGSIDRGFVEAYLSGVELCTADLTDRGAMRDLLDRERPDEIYNLASISSVAASWGAPVQVTEVNGVAVLGLLEEIRDLRDRHDYAPRLCQASSSEIFGVPRQLPQGETAPIAPTNPYGVAKALAHLALVNHREAYGLHASTVILFNHESPLRPDSFVTRKITTAAARMARVDEAPLQLGRTDVLRDWGYAGDYVRAMHLAVRMDEPDDYVIATGVSRTVAELVEVAFEAAGLSMRPGMVVSNADFIRPTDIPEVRGDPTKAETVLGWRREVSFADCIRHMVDVDLRRLDTGIEHDAAYLAPESARRGP
jgi:GDPmannose 4,6-dehydratase